MSVKEQKRAFVMENKIKVFENKQVRTVWDADAEEWYFSVVDVVEILTDSADPKQYIKKMRSRDAELASKWGYNLYPC